MNITWKQYGNRHWLGYGHAWHDWVGWQTSSKPKRLFTIRKRWIMPGYRLLYYGVTPSQKSDHKDVAGAKAAAETTINNLLETACDESAKWRLEFAP